MVLCPLLHNPLTMYVVVCSETLVPVGLYHCQQDAIRAGYLCKLLQEGGFQVHAMLPGQPCAPSLGKCVFESKLA